jgi:predicted CopG family antitoxin
MMERKYTTIRITKEANEELKSMRQGRETAGDVIERMLRRRRKKK